MAEFLRSSSAIPAQPDHQWQTLLKQHKAALGRSAMPISAPKGDGLGPFWATLLELVGL